jgi:molybdate transport system regulatory protein
MSVEPKTKVWLDHGGRFVMGDSGLRLLLAINARGSLTLAAHDVGWSYRHAWEYVRRAERVLGVALTGSVPGKGTKRGTALTPCGFSILETLAALRERIDGAVGTTGPTPEEIASRGAARRRPTPTRRVRPRA